METVKKSVLVDGEIKLHPKRFENLRTLVKQYSLEYFSSIMVHDGDGKILWWLSL
jgi:hypothetical protein